GLAGIYRTLIFIRSILDLALNVTALDCLDGAAQSLDLCEIALGMLFKLIGEILDVIGAGTRINCLRCPRFISNDLLGPQCDPRGFLSGQCQRLIEAVGVKRLGSPKHCCQSLNCGANDVIFGLLCGQGGTGGLSVKAQHPGARTLRAESLPHNTRPHTTSSTEFRDLFQKLIVSVEEK